MCMSQYESNNEQEVMMRIISLLDMTLYGCVLNHCELFALWKI